MTSRRRSAASTAIGRSSAADVLNGLIDGIAEFTAGEQQRWHGPRPGLIGPALLGCTHWLTDRKLLGVIEELPGGACIVISKPPITERDRRHLDEFRACNERAMGFPKRALSELANDEPTTAGKPAVIGRYDQVGTDFMFEPIRTACGAGPAEAHGRTRS